VKARQSSVATGALFAALICAWVSPLQGQSREYAAVSLDDGNRAPLVVIGTRLPIGSVRDASGREGTAWLLANTLAAQTNAALGRGAEVTVDVGRSTTLFTLSVLPDTWLGAWAILQETLFDATLDSAAFEHERSRLSAQLLFQRGSPALDYERRWVQQVAPPSSPWARSPRGTHESVEALTIHDARLLRRNEYYAASSVVAAVGVGDNAVLSDRPSRVVTSPPEGPAWTTSARLDVAQEVTSSWISVAYPIEGPPPRTALEFIAHLIRWRLDPLPPDPDRYEEIEVRLVDTPLGALIVVEGVVSPESSERFEQKILQVVSSLTEKPPEGDFFTWDRRRFRAARLLAEATPELSVARITSDLMRDGDRRDVGEDIWEITPAAVASALLTLGEPRVFRLGPDLESR
jgi:hypothetical protein